MRHDSTHEGRRPRVFDQRYFDDLSAAAGASERRRQHDNLHASHDDPCQRLFNAIGENSYIHPHRHRADPKVETLVAVRGRFALLVFDERGSVTEVVAFGTGADVAAVEVPPEVWHTVVALTPQATLFEVKPGPFDASSAKELAPWAPEERSRAAASFLAALQRAVVASRGAQYCRAEPADPAR